MTEASGFFGHRTDYPFVLSFPLSNNEVSALNSFKVYPNPVRDVLSLEFNLMETSNVNIEILNSLGELIIAKKPGILTSGFQSVLLDVNALSKGVYIVNINTTKGIRSKKIVVY